MNLRANAKLGPSGRQALVAQIEGGRRLSPELAAKPFLEPTFSLGASQSSSGERAAATFRCCLTRQQRPLRKGA
jgi:hypothetical protein